MVTMMSARNESAHVSGRLLTGQTASSHTQQCLTSSLALCQAQPACVLPALTALHADPATVTANMKTASSVVLELTLAATVTDHCDTSYNTH